MSFKSNCNFLLAENLMIVFFTQVVRETLATIFLSLIIECLDYKALCD